MEAPEILRQQVAEVAARRADRDEVAATVKFVEVVEEPTATLGSDLSSLVREVAA